MPSPCTSSIDCNAFVTYGFTEGAILLNHKGEQFMIGKHPQADLAPRDVVAKEIFNQMQISGQPHVWLDATKISDFANRFPKALNANKSPITIRAKR